MAAAWRSRLEDLDRYASCGSTCGSLPARQIQTPNKSTQLCLDYLLFFNTNNNLIIIIIKFSLDNQIFKFPFYKTKVLLKPFKAGKKFRRNKVANKYNFSFLSRVEEQIRWLVNRGKEKKNHEEGGTTLETKKRKRFFNGMNHVLKTAGRAKSQTMPGYRCARYKRVFV